MHNVEIRNSLINVSEIRGKALALNAFHFIYNQVFERLKIKHASPLAGRKTSLFYFEALIRNGADINQVVMGESMLHTVVATNYNGLSSDVFRITKILIDQGADVNAKNGRGITPFKHAIENFSHFPDFLKLFLDKNIDFSANDMEGKTIMDYARKMKHKASSDLILAYYEIAQLTKHVNKDNINNITFNF